jgi:DNA-binding IclR family transcriptional regulator
MKVSISKSVGRAFEVLEAFRETRKPASATDIRKHLGYPHSSVVAVLHNLVDVGYLSYDPVRRLYFPTHKLYKMAAWLRTGLIESSSFHDLAAAIALGSGETAAITGRSFIFLNIIHVQKGDHPGAAQTPCGIGSTLFRSTPGLVVVSQMKDEEIARLVRYANHWSKKTKAELGSDLDQVMDDVTKIREDGYGAGFDCWLPGIGAIAYPLSSPFNGTPLAISVTGPTARIRAEAEAIHAVLETYLDLHDAGATSFPRMRTPRERDGRATPRLNGRGAHGTLDGRGRPL